MMNENAIPEELLPMARQARKHRRRLVLLVLAPVVLFWVSFGYRFYQVKGRGLGDMNFVPRCRVVIHEMLGERFKYEPKLTDYGDWAPLATAKLPQGQIRSELFGPWERFHDVGSPSPNFKLADETITTSSTSTTGYNFLFTPKSTATGDVEGKAAALMLPIGPTGEVSIPSLGSFAIHHIRLRVPDTGESTDPGHVFNSQGIEQFNTPSSLEFPDAGTRGYTTRAAVQLRAGSATLVGDPSVNVFDTLNHAAVIPWNTSSLRHDPSPATQRMGDQIDIRLPEFCITHPTALRFGIEVLARQPSPLQMAPVAGAVQTNDHFGVRIVEALAGAYELGGWGRSPSDTRWMVNVATNPEPTKKCTFILQSPADVFLEVVAVDHKNREYPKLTRSFRELHVCSFPLPLGEISSLRVTSLLRVRCVVDVGPVEPFGSLVTTSADVLDDVIPEFTLEGYEDYSHLLNAIGGSNSICGNGHFSGLTKAKLKRMTIRQILQHIESDPLYRGDKLLIEQKTGWIWSGM